MAYLCLALWSDLQPVAHGGKPHQNVERDLRSWLQPKLALQLEPYVMISPAVNNDGEVEPCTFSVVAPHDYIRAAHRI